MEGFDHKVADISLHEWGRKEIDLAEVEMPGTIFTLLCINALCLRTHGCQN